MAEIEFHDTYRQCRNAFLDACSALDVAVRSFKLPFDNGPDGEGLFIDSVLVGDPDAAGLLNVSSGIHGVEGAAGSNAQTQWLMSDGPKRLPDNVAVHFIHAVNPWGFAMDSRTNENNVDLNRNFLDFPKLPETPARYEAYHEGFRLSDPSEEEMAAIGVRIKQLQADDGMKNFMMLASGGQYVYADGLNFGGQLEEWSTTVVRRVFDEAAKARKAVSVIDYHTGLGEYADHIFLNFDDRDSQARARARQWFGAQNIDREDIGAGEDGKKNLPRPDYIGLLATDLASRAPQPENSMALVIEFGTYPVMDVVPDIIKENWVRRQRAENPAQGRDPVQSRIVQSYKEKFIPRDPAWRDAVFTLSEGHLKQAVAGLSDYVTSI